MPAGPPCRHMASRFRPRRRGFSRAVRPCNQPRLWDGHAEADRPARFRHGQKVIGVGLSLPRPGTNSREPSPNGHPAALEMPAPDRPANADGPRAGRGPSRSARIELGRWKWVRPSSRSSAWERPPAGNWEAPRRCRRGAFRPGPARATSRMATRRPPPAPPSTGIARYRCDTFFAAGVAPGTGLIAARPRNERHTLTLRPRPGFIFSQRPGRFRQSPPPIIRSRAAAPPLFYRPTGESELVIPRQPIAETESEPDAQMLLVSEPGRPLCEPGVLAVCTNAGTRLPRTWLKKTRSRKNRPDPGEKALAPWLRTGRFFAGRLGRGSPPPAGE